MNWHRASKEGMRAEVAAAEGRGKAEAEKAALQSALDAAAAQAAAQQSSLQLVIQRLETDAKDYKVTSRWLFQQLACCAVHMHASMPDVLLTAGTQFSLQVHL